MRVTVTGRHAELTAELKTYVQEKAGRLDRYYDRVHTVEVVFDVDGPRHRCEVIARADHAETFVASEQHVDAQACLDAALRDVERQLNRHKEKFRNRKHAASRDERRSMSGESAGSPSAETQMEGESS